MTKAGKAIRAGTRSPNWINTKADNSSVHRFGVAARPDHSRAPGKTKKALALLQGHLPLLKTISILGKYRPPLRSDIVDRVNVAEMTITICNEAFMRAFVFKCPNACRNVQHWLDEDEDVSDNEYEVIKCAACAKLHFINRRTGDLMGAKIKSR
jgi:hypothetical protein